MVGGSSGTSNSRRVPVTTKGSTRTSTTSTTSKSTTSSTIVTTGSRAKQQMEQLRKQQKEETIGKTSNKTPTKSNDTSKRSNNTPTKTNSRLSDRSNSRQRVPQARSRSRDTHDKDSNNKRATDTKNKAQRMSRMSNREVNDVSRSGSKEAVKTNNISQEKKSHATKPNTRSKEVNNRSRNGSNKEMTNKTNNLGSNKHISSDINNRTLSKANKETMDKGSKKRSNNDEKDSKERSYNEAKSSNNVAKKNNESNQKSNFEQELRVPDQPHVEKEKQKDDNEVRGWNKTNSSLLAEEEHEEVMEEEHDEDEGHIDEEIFGEDQNDANEKTEGHVIKTDLAKKEENIEKDEEMDDKEEDEYEDDFDPYEDDDFEEEEEEDEPIPILQKSETKLPKQNLRSSQLLSMIRLDISSQSLLELPPIEYDKFMLHFGRSSTMQQSAQTGDDDIEIEVQTEKIQVLNKWTQKPICSTIILENESISELINGVGTDHISNDDLDNNKVSNEFNKKSFSSNSFNMSEWLEESSQLLNTILTEHRHLRHQDEVRDIQVDSRLNKIVKISRNVTLPDDKMIRLLVVNENSSLLLSISHANKEMSSFLSIWRLASNTLARNLVARAIVSAASFSVDNSSLISGTRDGGIVVFDLKENNSIDIDNQKFLTPTIVTTKGTAHNSCVMSVIAKESAHSSSFSCVSVEKWGRILFWTIVRSNNDVVKSENELGRWGNLSLALTRVLDLEQPINELCFVGNKALLALDDGNVLGLDNEDDRRSSKLFRSDFDSGAAVTVLQPFPYHDLLNQLKQEIIERGQEEERHELVSASLLWSPLFLAGSDDGRVRLHSLALERPLISWLATMENTAIKVLSHSNSRPCVFVVLDTLSRIHIWDLAEGDLYPIQSIQLNNVTTMAMSKVDLKDGFRRQQWLALAKGNVLETHAFRDEYLARNKEEQRTELVRFLHYISIV